MSTSSSDSPVFQIYLVLICLALLLLKKEHICLLSPSYTICHEAELLSPFFWQVQRPQVCSNSRITGRETASAAPGISGCDLEAMHGSTPGPAQQVSTWPEWGSSQDPKDRKHSAGKLSPSPGAAQWLTSHWRLSLSSSFQCPQPSCLLTPTVHQPHPSLPSLLNSLITIGLSVPLLSPPLKPSDLAGHRTVHLNDLHAGGPDKQPPGAQVRGFSVTPTTPFALQTHAGLCSEKLIPLCEMMMIIPLGFYILENM